MTLPMNIESDLEEWENLSLQAIFAYTLAINEDDWGIPKFLL